MELFKTVTAYLFIFENAKIYINSIKPIEKLSIQHLINFFDVYSSFRI